MTRKRKPLGDALAKDFVYGGNEPSPKSETIEDKQPPDEDKQPPEIVTTETVDNPAPKTEPIVERPLSTQSSLEPTPTKELSLMDKLQIEAKEATTRFTVDLPNTMHRKLSILAARTGRKKAEIVRLLLDEALKDVED